MAMQSLFARAVNSSLPSAIPTTLERIDQFAIGKVLTYQKKPRKLLPWRRHELNFTGRSITELLAEGQQLNFATSSEFLFDAGKGTDKISVEIGLDGELKAALSKLDIKLQSKEEKNLSISTDFGKITHVQTDLFEVLHAMRIRVNRDHPIIKEARKYGNTIFVISTIFQVEHCNIGVSVSEKVDDSASATVQAGGVAGVTEGGSLEDSQTSVKVANRDKPTPIGYLLLRLVINSNGELIPKLNNRLDQDVEPRIDMIDAPQGAAKSKLTVPRINPTDSVVGDWVMVDMVREWKPEDSMEVQAKPQETGQKPSHLTATMDIPQRSLSSSLSVPSLDPHYVYSLREFQCFSSNTYEGIFGESRRWVKPIRANPPLRQAFLSYAKPPDSHLKLKKLSECLQAQGNALRMSEEPPPNTDPALEPVLQAISKDWGPRLKENTSLVVISEACLEFPQHVLQRIIDLKPDKRELLLNVIKHTPYGVGRHVAIDEGPYNDPDLFPIMRHMGFSVSDRRLVFTAPDDTEDDVLAAGIIVIMLSE